MMSSVTQATGWYLVFAWNIAPPFAVVSHSQAGFFSVIGSTPVWLSSVMEKCAQSMWRLLVKIVPSLTGDSFDGNMAALAGELVTMDADVILGCGFVEHIFSEYKDNFLESVTALESCDEFHDLPNKASTLAGAGGRQSSTGFVVPTRSVSRDKGQSSSEGTKKRLVWRARLGSAVPSLLAPTFRSFSSHGISHLGLRRRSAPLRKGVLYGGKGPPGPGWSLASGGVGSPGPRRSTPREITEGLLGRGQFTQVLFKSFEVS